MLNHKSIIAQQHLTASQKKQLTEAQKQIRALDEVVQATLPDRIESEDYSQLHLKRDEALNQLAENFSIENAEKFHAAEMRLREAVHSAPQIATASHEIYLKVSAGLRGIVDDVLNRAAEAVKAHVAEAVGKLDPQNPFANKRQIEGSAQVWLQGIESERQHSQDPLDWICRNIDLE